MIPVGLSHCHVVKFLNYGNLTTSYQLSLCLERWPNSWEQGMFLLRPKFKSAFIFQRGSRIWWSKFYFCKHFFPPLLLSRKSDSTNVNLVERHQILLGQKCKPRADGEYIRGYFLAKFVLAENQKLASAWHRWKMHTQSESPVWPWSFCSCGTWGFIAHRRMEPFTFLGIWCKRGTCDLFQSAPWLQRSAAHAQQGGSLDGNTVMQDTLNDDNFKGNEYNSCCLCGL